MKKTYIAPSLRSVELGVETTMLTAASNGWKNADSATQKDPFSSKNQNNGIWDNNLWGTVDKN